MVDIETSSKVYIGIGSVLFLSVLGIFIYGAVTKNIQGNNFYLFKSTSGDIIVGSLLCVFSVVLLIMSIFIYRHHDSVFREQHENIHKDFLANEDNLTSSGTNPYKTYEDVQRQLRLKNINIFLLMLLFSFYFAYLGSSCFINEENFPSMYQAYRRPCPENTFSAEDTKHPNSYL